MPTSTADGAALIDARRALVDSALIAFCDRELASVALRDLAPVVRYAVLGGGKRFRGVLLIAAYESVAGGGGARAARLAACVEVMHAYSLIHDDLPCMDDDDLRRGRPSAHRAFSVELAVLAGVAMVPLAGRVARDACVELGLQNDGARAVVETLFRATGGSGMIAGQLLDLEGERTQLALSDLEQIHRAKTGALIAASASAGALAAGADSDLAERYGAYGRALGLAFQIADDLLDVTSSSAELGKTAGRDAALGKSTYPALVGVDGARRLAMAYRDEALTRLREVGGLTPLLAALADFVVERRS